jgi:hypothetical protein
MQKLSESVYSNLFWCISGMLVWLVILPIALICLPIIVLVKAAGQILFQMPQQNVVESTRKPLYNSESQSTDASKSLLTSLLLVILIEVPALLAAVISLQPERFIKGESAHSQSLGLPSAKAHETSSQDTIEP